MKQAKRILSVILVAALLISTLAVGMPTVASAAGSFASVGGWNETIYAKISGIKDADVTGVSYTGPMSGSLTGADLEYLVRDEDGYTRIDILGLTAGTYTLTVNTTSGDISQSGIVVPAQDRSGFAHYNDTEGVGAYTNDGKLKANAIVLYVTDSNKNTVSVTSKDGTTVTGIGNILGSTGMDVGGGVTNKGGKPNTNQDILRKLAADGTPLVVRLVGNVTAPDGLTAYDSIDYGGSVGDNGYMARMSGGKNITIEGVGANATINGWGMHFMCQTADYAAGYGRSFEVRNITFRNVPEDCVGMEGQQEGSTLTAPVERCWIHNCSFYAPKIANPAESDKDGGDGACDFKRGQYMTMSYCYYEGYHKTNLVGSSDTSLQYHITWHHNYWKNCDSRGPLGRQADMHIYNCVYEGQTSYCMNPRANCYIFSEYNLFLHSKNPVQVKSGAVKSYNDVFSACNGDNNATVVTDKSAKVSSGNLYENFDTDANLCYIPSGDYSLQEDVAAMKAVVMATAGSQPETIVSPEDIDTSVIPSNLRPTAPVALPYHQSLNSSYVTSKSCTKDNILFNVQGIDGTSLKLGGNATGCDVVFYVNTPVNISVTDAAGTNPIALCSEDGITLLTGSGTVKNVPAGYYFVQSSLFDGGKYKDARISELSIEAVIVHGDNDHVYTGVVTKPTCTEGGYTTFTCSCGASYVGDETPATGHTPGEAATCLTAQTCTVCGATVKAALGHSYANGSCIRCGAIDPSACAHGDTVVNGYKESTCSAEGYTGDTFCNTCKTIVKTGASIAKKAHTPGAAATCTTAQTCTVCGATVKAALGHSYANGSCTVCGAEDLTAKGYVHNITESGLTSDFYQLTGSTSPSKGTVTYNGITMTDCLKVSSSASIGFTAPQDGTMTLVFNPSCSGYTVKINGGNATAIPADGIITFDVTANTSYTVTKGKSESFLYYLAFAPAVASHTCTWGEGVVTSAADCTNDGVMTYTCTVSGCGKTKTEVIPATGHKPGAAATCVAPQTCTVCGAVVTPATGKHSYVNGKCSVCGAVDASVCQHANTTLTGDKQATCTAEGYTGDTYCNDCKTVIKAGSVIAKTNHTPGPAATCTTAQTCTVCGTTLNAATGHNYVNGTCSSCGKAEPVVSVTAAGHLESAYAEWAPVEGADGYNVYVKSTSASSWTQLDNMLIRQYKDHMRADAVGLKAGTYQMKIVPLANGTEQTAQAITTDTLTVLAHDRSGYAFVSGASLKGGQTVTTSSGAYNDDGTLKSNAVVVYVTEANKNTVTATIGGVSCTGIAAILGEVDKATAPVCIRLIGNITDPAGSGGFDKGDLLIDNAGNSVGLTIEGIGEDATCNGFGIRLKNSSNVEIRNLAVMNVDSSEGDNIGIQQTCDHIWVHNCDLFYGLAGSDADQAKGDGALDTKKSEYVTHSYNHFWDCGKCCLQGGTSSDTSMYITYHHNWFDHSDSRHPRVRRATVHVYNNFYDGNAKYGIGSTTDSDIFSEANYFENCRFPMLISMQGSDKYNPLTGAYDGEGTFSGEVGGIIKAYGNVIVGAERFVPNSEDAVQFDAVVVANRNDTVDSSVTAYSGGAGYNNFDTASDFYKYNVQTAEDAKATVMEYSGRMNGGDFQWTFTDADDTDYGVNQELKAALAKHDDQIVAIGGNSASVNPGPDPTDPTDPTPTDPTDPVNPPVPASSIVHNFTDDGFTSSFYSFAGNHLTTGKHGTYTYDFGSGTETLNNALKFDSGGSVTFTPTADGTVTIAVASNTAGRTVVISDGTSNVGKITLDTANKLFVLTANVSANVTYTVKRSSGESALYYIAYAPNTPAVEPFNIPGVSMTLGSSLAMYYYVPTANITDGCYARITKTYADHRADKVVEIPFAGCPVQTIGGVNYYRVAFDGIAAKEMTDELTCVAYNADGTAISNPKTTSVEAYALKQLETTTNAKLRTVLVDMLNYGALAQKQFQYNTAAPANAKLTDVQKGYATGSIDISALKAVAVKGTGWKGCSLTLQSNIQLTVFFDNTVVTKDMTAKISYTDHYGKAVSYDIPGSAFSDYNASTLYVSVGTLAAADLETVVSIDIMSGDTLVGHSECNMAQYCTLAPTNEMVVALAKYCKAAYNYFHTV